MTLIEPNASRLDLHAGFDFLSVFITHENCFFGQRCAARYVKLILMRRDFVVLHTAGGQPSTLHRAVNLLYRPYTPCGLDWLTASAKTLAIERKQRIYPATLIGPKTALFRHKSA